MNLAALKSRDFQIYLIGNVFSVNALWMLRVTVGWIAWDLTGSASFVGLIAFLYFAPTMVAGPLFGVLTDRVNVRHAALLTQSSLMSLSLLLLLVYVMGWLSTPQLVIYSVTAGLVMAANGPVRMSLTPRLVEKADVSSVVTIVAINFNLARMTGPALGGVLIAVFGVSITLSVIAVCYLPFLVALSILRVRPRDSRKGRPPPMLTALREGVHYVVMEPEIRNTMVITAVSSFFLRGSLEILPVLADGVFNRGAAGLGALTSAAGLGAVLGGIVLAISKSPTTGTKLPPRVFLTVLCGLLGIIALGFTTVWGLALVLVSVVAFCATSVGIQCQSTVQAGIDDEIRGRVMSLWAVVAIGATALGAAGLGVLADIMGFGWTLILASLAALALIIGQATWKSMNGR